MKKILVILLLSLNFFSLVSAENSTGETSTGNVSTGNILEVTSATSDGKNVLKENPVESTMITYYYSQTCSHCQRLNKYLNDVDAYSKLNIDKREVSNIENSKKWTEDIKRLGLENKQVGVPFLIVNEDGKENVLIGVDEALAYFEPKLGKVVETKVEQKDNKNAMIFMIVILILAVIIPFAFIKKSK